MGTNTAHLALAFAREASACMQCNNPAPGDMDGRPKPNHESTTTTLPAKKVQRTLAANPTARMYACPASQASHYAPA